MGEGVDAELEGFEAGREIFDAVELVSPRAFGAFDVAVELGPLRRQDEEAQVALSACLLELGPELRPAIDLDALDAEWDLGDELVEEGCGAARGCAAGDEGDGPLRDRVVSREVLDGLVGSDVDEEGVDLDEFARPDWLHALGRRLAWRWPMMRKRRGPGLRRSIGTGVTTPLAMSFVRMRPTIETETSIPSRRKRTPSLRLPPLERSAARRWI